MQVPIRLMEGIETMKLKIVTQFEGWCRECGGTIPAGEQAYWKKGEGVRHIGCVPNPDVDCCQD